MQAIILKCPKGARFHFGNIALDENTSLDDTAIYPHSDTLFSALISTAFLIAPKEAPALIKAFSAGLVSHSSGFFCLETKSKDKVRWIFFFPKPVHTNFVEPPSGVNFKKVREVKFLSKAVWEAGYLAKEWFDSTHCRILPGGFVVTSEEADYLPTSLLEGREARIYQRQTYPKVRVHDLDQKEGYFHQASVQLGQVSSAAERKYAKTHYYFLLDKDLGSPLNELLSGVLEVLVDHGIGGERTVGCGRLMGIETQDFAWNLPPSEWGVNLSLVHPGAAISDCKYYKTILRGGRRIKGFGTEAYLQKVRLLLEGGILKSDLKGGLVPIGPQQDKERFLRSGTHLNAPLHEKLLTHV